jgi:hypothetical protein
MELVGPIPDPAASVELGDRLARRSTQLITAAGRAATAVGVGALAIAAAPVALVGAAVAGMATVDPIILGAIAAASSRVGDPAAWFVLARWDW